MMIGRRFAQLEILELVGVGGAAEVYRAVDLRRGREVAVKILSERAEPEMIRRFEREGEALSRLVHPHIAQVHRMGEAQGLRFIVMELLPGKSLKERIQDGRLGWQEAVGVAIEIAEALQYAHQHGIVHRDVKPGNIMFDEVGRAKLMDFGLARLVDVSGMTRTGTVMGTVFYLSPEQAVGKHVDGRSDLYALGAVLFEMITGEPPFTGPSAVSILYKHLNEQPPRLRELDNTLPGSVDAAVECLLRKDPERRFEDATKTIAALTRALSAQESDQGFSDVRALPSEEKLSKRNATLPFVGRDGELRALTDALDEVVSGLGQTRIIAGEAGAGKTRLVREFDRVARERNALTLIGDCLYSDVPNPYAPFVEIIRALGERAPFMSSPDTAHGLDSDVAPLLRDVHGVFGLNGSRSQNARGTTLTQGSPQDAQSHLFELLHQVFLAVSRQRPLVLVLDDMQWASPTTLQLFHYLARSIGDARILLLGTYRPEDVLPGRESTTHPLRETLRRMSREHLHSEVCLLALDHESLGSLVGRVLNADAEELDPEFLNLLSRECEGNPFYLLEMLGLLQDEGMLKPVADRWELASAPGAIAIPGTVLDVIMRRVEQVDAGERELLEWAAVAGQRMDVGTLAALVDGSRVAVLKRLHGIAQSYGLVLEDEQGFQFEHAKVRQALYEALPISLRREYHLSVGEMIEQRYQADLTSFVYDLARHFVQGNDPVRGYKYARSAADKAEAAYALLEAITYLEQALALLDNVESESDRPEQHLKLQHRYARLLLTVGRQKQACATLESALALGRALGNGLIQAEILLDLSVARGRAGDWEAAIRAGEQSFALASSLGDSEHQASAQLTMGFFAFESGHWDDAMERLGAAYGIAQTHSHELLRARILGNMGIVHDATGEKERAVEMFLQSSETFSHLDKPLDVGRVLNNMGFAYQGLGRHKKAMECYEQALDLFNKVGDVREQGIACLHLAEVLLALERPSEARTQCVHATRRFSRVGFDLGKADVDRVYAGIARMEQRWEVAERYLREALAVYEERGDRLNLAETHEELGKLLAQVGQGDEATEQLDRSRTIFEGLRV